MARLTIPDAVPLDVRFEIASTLHGAISDVREPGLWLMLDALALMIFDPDDPDDPDDPELADTLDDALLLICARRGRALDPRAFAALFIARRPAAAAGSGARSSDSSISPPSPPAPSGATYSTRSTGSSQRSSSDSAFASSSACT
ncbi:MULTISPECIES: hypothetical protein [Mumia]|uniref:hypothetical protein n=1 Tax=Mumia TaxID=1546255 RepID=UPI00142152BF|nr:hypothetical protein [Mumia sp. ZJ430]